MSAFLEVVSLVASINEHAYSHKAARKKRKKEQHKKPVIYTA